jgi:hypothetical protein
VKVREHPLMSYRGITNWPPTWIQATETGTKTVNKETGVLRYVLHFGKSTNILLVIDHENQLFVGTLLFSDDRFCDHIATLLKTNIGRSIKEIGDLDLSAWFRQFKLPKKSHLDCRGSPPSSS